MKKTIFVVFLFCTALVPIGALATTYQVTASDDYYSTRDWWSGGNYSENIVGTQEIKNTYWYDPGNGGHKDELRLGFDLASLAAVDTDDIVSVSLFLNITSAYNSGPGIYAANLYYGGTTRQVLETASGWTTFDFTDALKTRLAAGDSTASFSGNNSSPAKEYNGVGFVFTSMESGLPAYMEINTAPVPEPATIFLFGAGLAGFVGGRFRKKK